MQQTRSKASNQNKNFFVLPYPQNYIAWSTDMPNMSRHWYVWSLYSQGDDLDILVHFPNTLYATFGVLLKFGEHFGGQIYLHKSRGHELVNPPKHHWTLTKHPTWLSKKKHPTWQPTTTCTSDGHPSLGLMPKGAMAWFLVFSSLSVSYPFISELYYHWTLWASPWNFFIQCISRPCRNIWLQPQDSFPNPIFLV